MRKESKKGLLVLLSTPVIVASLGYFVDIYDLLLFGIVRLPSLMEIGVAHDDLSIVGSSILSWQMSGLLIGGVVWGTLGDKHGRLSVLFGSILTYSLANIACGFVEVLWQYKLLRFVAGIGLAGELGVGITLVSESLPTRYRALGTSLVSGVGLLGAVVAYFTVSLFDWRIAYFMGGGMGVALLIFRINISESTIFSSVKHKQHIERGNFFSLFTSSRRFKRYIQCIGIGLPTWFVIGILSTFSDEVGSAKNLEATIDPGISIMWCYVGLSIGDVFSGVLSYMLASRRYAIACMLAVTVVAVTACLAISYTTTAVFYLLIAIAGFGIGYWAMFVTVSAEQFGANLRATVATTVPNMVRGSVVVLAIMYQFLKQHVSVMVAALAVGFTCFILALWALYHISETHSRDLDFSEDPHPAIAEATVLGVDADRR